MSRLGERPAPNDGPITWECLVCGEQYPFDVNRMAICAPCREAGKTWRDIVAERPRQ